MLTVNDRNGTLCLVDAMIIGYVLTGGKAAQRITLLLDRPIRSSAVPEIHLYFRDDDSVVAALVDLANLIVSHEAGASNEWEFTCERID